MSVFASWTQDGSRGRGGFFVLLVSALAAFAVSAPGARAAGACGNEVVREVQGSTFLPDCRAYELVTPGSNPFLSAANNPESDRASVTGESIAYLSFYPAEGVSNSGYYYLATRGEKGWSVREVEPQNSPNGSEGLACEPFVYFSADLSRSVLSDGWNPEVNPVTGRPESESYCEGPEEQLALGAPSGYQNLYYREGAGEYQLVNVTPPAVLPANAQLQDASEDLSHVLFSEKSRLTPEAAGLSGHNLYEWSAGTVRLVAFLPGGEPVEGRLADGPAQNGQEGAEEGPDPAVEGHEFALAATMHAMSGDGETVFFYAEHEGGMSLYARVHAMREQSGITVESGHPSTKVDGEQCSEPEKACTIEIDRVQGGSGASGGGVFWDASAEGTRVFFTDERDLTAGAGATTQKPDLYEYDLETGQLVDVTPEALAGESADARGLSGASENGSYLYFVAKGALTGAQKNGEEGVAQKGKPNLYLDHEGALTFIATLFGPGGKVAPTVGDFEAWQEQSNLGHVDDGELDTRFSPNGLYLAFSSYNELTGISNKNAEGKSEKELFLYDAAADDVVCVSCGNRRPAGETVFPLPARVNEYKAGVEGAPVYLSRNVLDDGRVFFTSPNALVEGQEGGVDNVFEYEEGHVRPISAGTSSEASVFYDASADGRDVFFVTEQSLVGGAKEGADRIYDAREGGGWLPNPAEEEQPECEGEACRRPASEPPAQLTAASSVFAGPGDVMAPPSEPEHPKGGEVHEHKTLTRAQRLAKALQACREDRAKTRRKACEARARERYGAKSKSKSKTGKKGKKSGGGR